MNHLHLQWSCHLASDHLVEYRAPLMLKKQQKQKQHYE